MGLFFMGFISSALKEGLTEFTHKIYLVSNSKLQYGAFFNGVYKLRFGEGLTEFTHKIYLVFN